MKIIIDEREHAVYEKCDAIVNYQGNSTTIQLSKKVLPLGDILITTDEDKDVMLIERKTLADLLSSIKDGRYEEQSHRLIHSSGIHSHCVLYLIEGIMTQLRTQIEKKTIFSAMTSLNYFKGFSVCRTSSLQETAEYIVWMAQKIDRNFSKGILPFYLNVPRNTISNPDIENLDSNTVENAVFLDSQSSQIPQNYCTVVKKVKKDNITPNNIGEIILCQIPGISSVTAIAIMKQFDSSFPKFMEEMKQNPQCLDMIVIETNGKKRKINKPSIQNIIHFLLTSPTAAVVTESVV